MQQYDILEKKNIYERYITILASTYVCCSKIYQILSTLAVLVFARLCSFWGLIFFLLLRYIWIVINSCYYYIRANNTCWGSLITCTSTPVSLQKRKEKKRQSCLITHVQLSIIVHSNSRIWKRNFIPTKKY